MNQLTKYNSASSTLNPELVFVTDVSKELSKHGTVDVCYITAELEPFSKQQKPDIFFSSPNGKKKLFLVYEIYNKSIEENLLLNRLMNFREFAVEDKHTDFVFSTNIYISNKNQFNLKDILIFDRVHDQNEFMKEFNQWLVI